MVAGNTVVGSSPTSSSILAYSVTVSTKHFDCFSLGSNPSKPTIISGSRGVRFISLALDARARRFESCLPDGERLFSIHRAYRVAA